MRWALGLVVLALGCQRPAAEAPKLKAPEPLPRLSSPATALDAGSEEAREAIFKVEPFKAWGAGVPGKAGRVEVEGSVATINGTKVDLEDPHALAAALGTLGAAPVMISARGETWVMHGSPLFAALDDLRREVWLRHPDLDVAYPVLLRDAASFQGWLDEPAPGKVRVIQRADGFELTTGMGKLLAADPNGPSVPVRGGSMDLPALQRGLIAVKGRFKNATDLCFMPSFGTPLADAIRTLAADWKGTDGPIFEKLCFVYPRPEPVDAGR